jgi:predicted O-methyltransferase YrrM
MNIDAIIKETGKVVGFFGDKQQRAFYPFVQAIPADGLLVEIGTYHGKSAKFFSLVNPNMKILTIDCMATDNKDGVPIDKDILTGGNIFQITGRSEEVFAGFNWEIDFLFIDGDHSYVACKRDLVNWSPFVKRGGHIALHDYNNEHWPGVVQATDEFIEQNKDYKPVIRDTMLHLCFLEKL